MKATHLRLLALAFGIVIFDFLFYKQAPGLNALILAPVILVLIKLSGRNPILNIRLLISAGGMLLAGVSVALYGSFISVLAYFGAFGVLLDSAWNRSYGLFSQYWCREHSIISLLHLRLSPKVLKCLS
jgi:hypothetical protein